MKIFKNNSALQTYINSFVAINQSIGFVPTMGALHEGHLALIKKSLENNVCTVVSIFINPTQFNNIDDLKKYPRTLDVDIEKIMTLSKDVIVYAPTVEDIYPEKAVAEKFDFDGLENVMEGKFRPGHFNGVGTVVRRLFEIVKPTNAYFGEKDFQQLQIVKKMVEKNNLSVNIIPCEVYREVNGLAMSSRNERLTSNERKEAAIIYKTLLEVKNKFKTNSLSDILTWVNSVFEKHAFELEYFVIANEATLLPCTEKEKNKKYRAFIAVIVNSVRLIDTISLN